MNTWRYWTLLILFAAVSTILWKSTSIIDSGFAGAWFGISWAVAYSIGRSDQRKELTL